MFASVSSLPKHLAHLYNLTLAASADSYNDRKAYLVLIMFIHINEKLYYYIHKYT